MHSRHYWLQPKAGSPYLRMMLGAAHRSWNRLPMAWLRATGESAGAWRTGRGVRASGAGSRQLWAASGFKDSSPRQVWQTTRSPQGRASSGPECKMRSNIDAQLGTQDTSLPAQIKTCLQNHDAPTLVCQDISLPSKQNSDL